MSKVGAPLARQRHGAIWTGSRMFVWGGQSSGTWPKAGGSYDPATDSWAPMSADGAPVGRELPILVWTGSRLLVAGGIGSDVVQGPDLSIYDPATDTWKAAAPPPSDVATGMPVLGVWTGCAAVFWAPVDNHKVIGWTYEPPGG